MSVGVGVNVGVIVSVGVSISLKAAKNKSVSDTAVPTAALASSPQPNDLLPLKDPPIKNDESELEMLIRLY